MDEGAHLRATLADAGGTFAPESFATSRRGATV